VITIVVAVLLLASVAFVLCRDRHNDWMTIAWVLAVALIRGWLAGEIDSHNCTEIS